ncbi:MAG: DNA-methyltransferase [bacterium]
MNYTTNRRKDKNHEFCKPIKNDNNEKLIENYIEQCYRVLKDNSAIYYFANSNKIDVFKREIEKYFNIKNIIVWIKNSHTAGDLKAQYGKQYEFIIYANKGRREINGKRLTDVWYFDRIVGNEQIHQNQKPIELIKQCIEKSSNKNDIIFDGFMGSGTTAIASLLLSRKFIGFELDYHEWSKSIKRIGAINKNYLEELPKDDRPPQLQLF